MEFIFLEKKQKNLKIYETNRNDTKTLLGPPSTIGTFDNDIWKKTKIKKEKTEKKTWTFKSSSSDAVYTVRQVDSSSLKCNCPGAWRSRGNCKHIKEVRTSLTK